MHYLIAHAYAAQNRCTVLQTSDLYDPREQWASYLINALKSKELQIKDINYITRGEEVIIVDEFTGRTMPGRRSAFAAVCCSNLPQNSAVCISTEQDLASEYCALHQFNKSMAFNHCCMH